MDNLKFVKKKEKNIVVVNLIWQTGQGEITSHLTHVILLTALDGELEKQVICTLNYIQHCTLYKAYRCIYVSF